MGLRSRVIEPRGRHGRPALGLALALGAALIATTAPAAHSLEQRENSPAGGWPAGSQTEWSTSERSGTAFALQEPNGQVRARLLGLDGVEPRTELGSQLGEGLSGTERAAATCDGEPATIIGTKRSETIRGTNGRDVIVAKGGHDKIYGRGGDDLICAGSGNDLVVGGGGDDLILGGAGEDKLVGGKGFDFFDGGGGDDRIDGGKNFWNAVFYIGAPQGVNVNLSKGRASGWGADSLSGINVVVGSAHNDVIRGDAKMNLIIGLEGDDTINGGWGNDAVAYLFSQQPVAVDIEYGLATGEGTDRLSGIEAVMGSDFGDQISGDEGNNALFGGLGNDSLDGREGEDYLAGGDGNDSCRNGPVFDACEETDETIPDGSPSGDPTPPGEPEPPGFNSGTTPPDVHNLQSTRAGTWNLGCHPWTGAYTLTFPDGWTGWGYFAVRLEYGAFGPWVSSPWAYSNGAGYWWYDGQFHPTGRSLTIHAGGNIIVDAYWWSQQSGWVYMGRCLTTQAMAGLIITPR